MFALSISQPKWDSAKNKVLYQLLQLQLQYGLQSNRVRQKSRHEGDLHETAREVIAFFHVQLLSGALAERGSPRQRISFRELLGYGEWAQERRKGTCASGTLKAERIPPLFLPPKERGCQSGSPANRASQMPCKMPHPQHTWVVLSMLRQGNPALKALPVALCSNGPLVHHHHLPAAWRDPQRLSKIRKAKTQVKTCKEGLMGGQWMLILLLRALFGQYLVAVQMEDASQPGCTLHQLHCAAVGQRLGTQGVLAIISINYGVIPWVTALLSTAFSSSIQPQHLLSPERRQHNPLQSTATLPHFARSLPLPYSLMHLFMSVLRRPKYPSGQDGRQIPICRISFLSRRMKSLGEHLRHPLNSEHRSQPLAQP